MAALLQGQGGGAITCQIITVTESETSLREQMALIASVIGAGDMESHRLLWAVPDEYPRHQGPAWSEWLSARDGVSLTHLDSPKASDDRGESQVPRKLRNKHLGQIEFLRDEHRLRLRLMVMIDHNRMYAPARELTRTWAALDDRCRELRIEIATEIASEHRLSPSAASILRIIAMCDRGSGCPLPKWELMERSRISNDKTFYKAIKSLESKSLVESSSVPGRPSVRRFIRPIKES